MKIRCCQCGIKFSSPVLYLREKDHEAFWCPNGHTQYFGKSDEELESELGERIIAEQVQALSKLDTSQGFLAKIKGNFS